MVARGAGAWGVARAGAGGAHAGREPLSHSSALSLGKPLRLQVADLEHLLEHLDVNLFERLFLLLELGLLLRKDEARKLAQVLLDRQLLPPSARGAVGFREGAAAVGGGAARAGATHRARLAEAHPVELLELVRGGGRLLQPKLDCGGGGRV